jgi:sugar phosphate isomerase/epimerase
MNLSKMTRRQMVADSAKVIAGLVLAGGCVSAESISSRTSDRGFKIGVCDWILGKEPGPEAFEVAKRVGVDGIQLNLNTSGRPIHLQKPEVRDKYLKAAHKYGLHIPSIAIVEINNVPLKGNDPRAERWLSESIDVCRATGGKVVLLPFFGKGDLIGDEKGLAVVVEKLKKIAPKAEKAGVSLAVESYLTAEQHLDIINRVGSGAISVYYDVANSQSKGHDICREIRLLGKHIAEFHAKDYDGLYGKGSIDFKAVRNAIDDIGYRGWLVMEGTKMPLGIEESCRYDLQYLRQIFPSSV